VLFNSELNLHQLAGTRPKYRRIAAIRPQAVVLCSTPRREVSLEPGLCWCCICPAHAPQSRALLRVGHMSVQLHCWAIAAVRATT
jgi:hypothetical protein